MKQFWWDYISLNSWLFLKDTHCSMIIILTISITVVTVSIDASVVITNVGDSVSVSTSIPSVAEEDNRDNTICGIEPL